MFPSNGGTRKPHSCARDPRAVGAPSAPVECARAHVGAHYAISSRQRKSRASRAYTHAHTHIHSHARGVLLYVCTTGPPHGMPHGKFYQPHRRNKTKQINTIIIVGRRVQKTTKYRTRMRWYCCPRESHTHTHASSTHNCTYTLAYIINRAYRSTIIIRTLYIHQTAYLEIN